MSTFQRGDQVEVCCKEEGFNGAYYPAIIIAKMNRNVYMVQYDTLLRDDELAPLREMVPSLDLRPVPPYVDMDGYDVRDKVDAYANDGWWVGTVVKKVSKRGVRKKYVVKFEGKDQDDDEQEVGRYALEELRVHHDWVDGMWYCSKEMIP